MRRFQLLVFILLFSHAFTFAQHTLTGTLQDDKQEPLLFANVLLLTEGNKLVKGEVADADGNFTVTDIASGSYVLNISAIGYEPFQRFIEVEADTELGLISIATSSVALEAITVTAQKAAFVRKADRTIVNVGSLPTAAGGSALELLEKSPSVRVDRVSGAVSLLGREDVLVFINGKRARLDGNELLQYLSSIPAANIISLELINNPPASYDADGTGGVINVVLKDYEANSFNGSANLFGGYGVRGKYGGGVVFNYKSGKLNWYGDLATSQDYTEQNSDIRSSIQFDDGLLGTTQNSSRPAYIGNYNGKLGLTYDLQPNTSIDIFGTYAIRRWELEAETTTDYAGTISPVQNDLLTGSETNTTNQYNISTRVQHQFGNGHRLSFDYDYLNFDIVNPTNYALSNFNGNKELVNSQTFETDKETPFDFHVLRLDYQGALSQNINFETGVKATLSDVANNTALLDENGAPSNNPLFTDQMNLTEEIYAAYFSVDGALGDHFTFIGGLRYEYSDLNLTAVQGDVDRQISRLFPSLSLTRNFSAVTRLTLAYRERISRPGFQNLAPAFFFLNPYTVLTGNIQALPNINRTAEITLNYQSLFVSLSYSQDDHPIVRYAIPQLNQEDNLLLFVSDNIEGRQQIGLNVGFPITFTNFWNSRYSISSYWRRDEIQFGDQPIIEENPFLSIDIAQSFQLPQDWSLELSGRWNSRTYQGTIYQSEQTFVNFGVQKKFRNSTLGLSWSDIFDTGSFLEFVNELPEQGVVYNWNYDLEGSIVKLSYTYNFGGRKVKQSRNSGASEVLRRVNE
ncbi:MAG: TonB-dependent receptor [Bacteroidota bacterium]